MSTLTAIPVPARSGGLGAGAPRRGALHSRPLFDGTGGGPTLDDVLSGAWEELTAHAVVECPVCDGELAPDYAVQAPSVQARSSHARPIGGRCRRCGTTLS